MPDAWTGDLCGNCPVQGEGVVRGQDGQWRAWYFRARGESWEFVVAADVEVEDASVIDTTVADDLHFCREGERGKWPAAGYMPEADARHINDFCVASYLGRNGPAAPLPL